MLYHLVLKPLSYIMEKHRKSLTKQGCPVLLTIQHCTRDIRVLIKINQDKEVIKLSQSADDMIYLKPQRINEKTKSDNKII